ncbi:isochorismatase family protein [Streptomonospora algeriensis]|uniref:Isochorismatase family protein n=1 Tax=Streptomonospora algeriensis TaxID=995084 RepID=A0ABW3BFC5_9ACTN
MPLPHIEPYELPTPAELPPNRADWRPDPARAALLIHDMQRYFLSPYRPGAQPLAGALANIAALGERARAAGVPVVYTAKPGGMAPEDRGLERDFWGAGMRAAPDQSDIAAALRPREGDVLVTKRRYSAFVGTDLAERLEHLGRDQLLVTGVYAHIGCLLTAADAFMRDVQPFLVADATADFSAEDHRYALRYVAQRCGVALSAREAAAALAHTPALDSRV